MSNPIPPFVCSTPPPIDCIVDAPPPVDDDFGDFAAVDDQFEASSLPVTPVHVAKLPDNASAAIPSSIPPSPDKELNYTPKDDDFVADPTVDIKPIEQDNSSYTPASSKIDLKPELPYIIEANSPPPLDFAPDDDDLTPCDDLDNDDDDEVDEFPIDDAGKYDDNISLPSLKFDSLSNVSKSTTPVSDELTKSNHEDFDSISAFAPMPSGSMDEEATVLEECTTEKTAVGDVEVKAIPFEALTISEPPEDISDHVTMSVSRQSINENDDDFTEFEAFPAAPLQNDLESAFSEPPKDDFPAAETQGTGDFAFEADFSQFSSFEPTAAVQPPAVVSQTADNTQLTEKSSLDDLDADDFDDFQDFAVAAAAAAPVSATPVVEQRKASIGEATTQDIPPINSDDDEEEEDDDDDFGEFSEVIESETTSIPSSNSGFNLANLNDKLKPILEMMFPLANAMEEDEANHLKQLTTTSTTTTIDQIDTAKALEYQWNNSEMRHSLIKSLGVDSRNILYGEKWNSSMPRYAANLSFNPLEPMKSDKAAASSSSSTSSSTADYRKRSESLTTTSLKGDVPAVEFDWNSSGLVNPLDGVKEILHERTIEAIHTPQLGEPYPPIDQQSNSALTSNTNVYDSNKPPSHGRFIDEETISAPIEFKSHADASAAISTATATASAAAATPVTAATASPAALSDDYINITSGDYQHHHHHSHHSSVLETNIDSVLASTQASLNHSPHAAKYQESSKTDLETELQHSVVVTTSTYAGPLKETHIFTPSKSESILARSTASKTPRTSESSKCPIDFDYEIAAAGIIIDETVVKKEYRDVEYNPGFGLKYREEAEYNHSTPPDIDTFSSSYHSRAPKPPPELDDFNDFVSVVSEVSAKKASVPRSNSFDDEFSDFQSVPAPVSVPPTNVPSAINPSSVLAESKTSPSHLRKLKESERSLSNSRTGTPVSLSDEMILSPAILLPQAIQIESKPTIEWPEPGINPEEMARIEELFPQPKVGSNKPSPSHSGRSQPPPQQQQNRAAPDDDDWSEFVSVPASATSNHIQSISQQFQKRHASPAKSATAAADANDEEWSDFVSSAPPPANPLRQAVFPQFNSASWQNANFYNNPMSAYASPPTSFYYQPPQQQLNSSNLVPNLSSINNNTAAITNNNNIINNNNSINQYLINNQSHQQQQQHLHHQQHIQMMRDFSNSSPMDGGSIAASSIHQQFAAAGYGYKNNRGGMTTPHHGKSSQFGGASSKVAPSISLIPDLGFVAPTHTSFISVPKNSLITKK